MENILPANVPASSSPATAWEQLKHRASAPPTSLAEAQELLTALLAQQEVLLEENRHLHTVQQTLATSEARLQAAEAIAHLGSYELDLRSGAVQFSAGMYQLFGETPQMGTPSVAWMDSRTHPDDVPTIRRILAQARRNRQPYWYSRRIRRPDGQWRNLVSHGRVVCDAAGTAIRLESVVEDQTEARDAAQELLTAKEQLQVSLDNSLHVV